MLSILNQIYGPEQGRAAYRRIADLLEASAHIPAVHGRERFDQSDAVLITYADSLQRDAEPPLTTLHRFCSEQLKGFFSGLHILPFFPYSSDDGFAVTDFMAVRPDLGSWFDIRAISRDFKLMVDLVVNHVSAQSRWFGNYLTDVAGYRQLAIEVDPQVDLAGITRPRALPLLTEFQKRSGRRVHVWTTFSADQIDLNYRSLDVLEAMLRCLLFYVSQGARLIRLDAIAYLWKEIGTACIHLSQTHAMVRLFRVVLDQVAPDVLLVTETNVPHAENISYFGNGGDEAQMVYNFTLPPLLLHALCAGCTEELSAWARTLGPGSAHTTFFNFTASHDGIGVRPLEGILPNKRLHWLVDRIRRNGGTVSEKLNPDGSASPYELNCTYLDALKNPDLDGDPLQVARFLASQAVALVLPGVPGVYIHSLLGTRNWIDGVRQTGRARTINRRRLNVDKVVSTLAQPLSIPARIYYPYLSMLRRRIRQPAFHPTADMQVLALDERVFCVQRHCPQQTIYALTNLSADVLRLSLPRLDLGRTCTDLLSGRRVDVNDVGLAGCQTLWLTDTPY